MNLWPFVGVFIILLVVMMITSGPPFATHHGIPLTLPSASHAVRLPWAVREDAIRVEILRDERVSLNNLRVNVEDLHTEIRDQAKGGSERRVYMEVDGRVEYKIIKRVLDEIRDAKVENVLFIVDGKG